MISRRLIGTVLAVAFVALAIVLTHFGQTSGAVDALGAAIISFCLGGRA